MPDPAAAPILDAYRSADGCFLHVFCPHCRSWHLHLAAGVPRDIPVVSHCIDLRGKTGDMPSIRQTGYVLRVCGTISRNVVERYECRHGFARTKPL